MEGTGLRIVDSFRQPLPVSGQPADCTVSVGVAVSRHGDSAKDLFRFAQYALDDAKTLGRNRMIAFADEDRELLSPYRITPVYRAAIGSSPVRFTTFIASCDVNFCTCG